MAEPVAPPSTMVVGNEIKKRFLEWADSEPGVDVSPDVDLFHEFKEGYRGVVATKDIAADVVLVRVARSCCVGPETTDASHQDWKEVLASADVMNTSSGDGKAAPPRLTRACLTVLQLLHERGRGKASPFFPYLSVLPHDHRLPMEWNETELQLLQGTSVEPLVGTGSLDSQFEAFQRVVALHPTMWEPSVCTKAAFAKGINWVRSRGFTVLGDPHMIPGADMFNHDPDKQSVQIGTDGEDFFVMKTVHPVKAGEELFSSFGHISNAQLLNSYGFVLPGNSFDTVLIPTQLVVDTCYATFVNLEGKKLGEEEVKATWARRLAMLASNVDEGEGQEEAFLVSKYDLLPESLADMVQILTMSGDEEVVYATIAAVAQAKMGQYSPLLDAGKTTAAAAAGGGGECPGGGTEGAEGAEGAEGEKRQAIGADARTVAEMLVAEEKKVLGDLRVQLMSEILNDAEDDSDDQEQDDEDDASAAREGNKGSKRRKAA